ncbi:MAG: APC family permease, partial [Chlamydiales bacterium]
LAVSILTLLIGINYIIVCKYFPNGGGVYASLRRHSEVISLLGAFFLLADYIITAALSAMAAFQYLGVPHPTLYTIIAILLIGGLNYWGPRRSGQYAFGIAVASVLILVILFGFSIRHLLEGWHNLVPLSGKIKPDWIAFTGVVLTLSGIESAASMTAVFRLDPGASEKEPRVVKIASKAIWFSVIEAAFFTSFFTLMLTSINGLVLKEGNVETAQGLLVRDSAFRFLGSTFVGEILGPTFGYAFGLILAIFFGVLLLSAVNTSINSMINLFYLMAEDGELPRNFKSMNQFGVPKLPLIIATLLPLIVLLVVDNIAILASLYAAGFVGAITMNLGATSVDKKLPLKRIERILLAFSALIMFFIEATIFVTKIHAVVYLLSIIVIGLVLRGLAVEAKGRKKSTFVLDKDVKLTPFSELSGQGGALCIVKGRGQALKLAKEWAQEHKEPLSFLFICEQRVMSDLDVGRIAQNDPNAVKLFNTLHKELEGIRANFSYIVTDVTAFTISNTACRMKAKVVFMDLPRRGIVAQLLRGDTIREIWKMMPEEIDLFILPTL